MSFSPPTDSLYKFAAIVGTLIFILPLYYLQTNYTDYSREIAKLNVKAEIVKAETENLKAKSKQLADLVDNSIAANKKNYKLDPKKMHLYYSEKEVKQMNEQIQTDLYTSNIKFAELTAIKENIKDLTNDLRFILKWAWRISMAGLLLSMIGYLSWYYKIQIYQDKIIKQSAEESLKKEVS